VGDQIGQILLSEPVKNFGIDLRLIAEWEVTFLLSKCLAERDAPVVKHCISQALITLHPPITAISPQTTPIPLD